MWAGETEGVRLQEFPPRTVASVGREGLEGAEEERRGPDNNHRAQASPEHGRRHARPATAQGGPLQHHAEGLDAKVCEDGERTLAPCVHDGEGMENAAGQEGRHRCSEGRYAPPSQG